MVGLTRKTESPLKRIGRTVMRLDLLAIGVTKWVTLRQPVPTGSLSCKKRKRLKKKKHKRRMH